MLTWGMYDLSGGFLGPVRNRKLGSRVEIDWCGERRALLQLDLDDELAAAVEPLSVVLRAWLDEAPVFAGVVTEPTFYGQEGRVEIPATGPTLRLERAFIGQRSDGTGLTGHVVDLPFRLEGVPEGEIFWRLIDYASPTAAELAFTVPGHGIVRGNVTAGQVRDREYEPGKQIYEALVDLSNVIDGQDFDLRPIMDDANPEILCAFDTFDRMGTDRSDDVRLEFAVGDNTASDLVLRPSGEIVNRLTGVGEAPEYDGEAEAPLPPTYTADQAESQIAYGLHCDYQGLPGVSETDTVVEQVEGVVSTQAFPIDHFDITPALQDGSGYVKNGGRVTRITGLGRPPRFGPNGDWWVGDSFRAVGMLGVRYVDLHGRVTGAAIEEVDEGGNAQVTVQSAPRLISTVSS